MKKLFIILCVVLITSSLLISCKDDDNAVVSQSEDIEDTTSEQETERATDNDTEQSIEDDTASESILPAGENNVQQFNLNLLKEINDMDTEKNIFYSEYSIKSALSMAMMGASSSTYAQMAEVLGYAGADMCSISNSYEVGMDYYNNMEDSEISVANSMWIDDAAQINQDYVDKVELTFDAEVRDVDLQANDAVDIINGWISDKTNEMIQNMLQEPFHPLDRLVLANAIYFNGRWSEPFDKEDNTTMIFNGTLSANDVTMMTKRGEILGYEADGYKAISMPYGEEQAFSMVMVLTENDIDEFIAQMDDENYDSLFYDFELKDSAYIAVPKFEAEERLDMGDILMSLGMVDAFSMDADFSNIANDLHISEVIHQAKVKVDEEGTEAAAATVVVMRSKGMLIEEERFEFVADKPFIFFIVDNADGTPLFTGVIKNLE